MPKLSETHVLFDGTQITHRPDGATVTTFPNGVVQLDFAPKPTPYIPTNKPKQPMNAEQLARDIASLPQAHSILDDILHPNSVPDGSIEKKAQYVHQKFSAHSGIRSQVKELLNLLNVCYDASATTVYLLELALAEVRNRPQFLDIVKAVSGYESEQRRLSVKCSLVERLKDVIEFEREANVSTAKMLDGILARNGRGIEPGSSNYSRLLLIERLLDEQRSKPDKKWEVLKCYDNDGRNTYRVVRKVCAGTYEIANTLPISKELADRMAEELNRG